MSIKSVFKYLSQETQELIELPRGQLRSIITLLLYELDLSRVIKGLVYKLLSGGLGKGTQHSSIVNFLPQIKINITVKLYSTFMVHFVTHNWRKPVFN